MDKVKLKPCPFCGGEVTIKENSITNRNGRRMFYAVRCPSCGMLTSFNNGVIHSKEKTVAAWNKRAPEKDNLAK